MFVCFGLTLDFQTPRFEGQGWVWSMCSWLSVVVVEFGGLCMFSQRIYGCEKPEGCGIAIDFYVK